MGDLIEGNFSQANQDQKNDPQFPAEQSGVNTDNVIPLAQNLTEVASRGQLSEEQEFLHSLRGKGPEEQKRMWEEREIKRIKDSQPPQAS